MGNEQGPAAKATASEKRKITKRVVDAVEPPPRGELRIWDTEIKGFYLRVWASGRKVYCVRYRLGAGAQRTFTIGEHGAPWIDDEGASCDLTPERARQKARLVLAEAERGMDPTAEKQKRREAISVGELIDRYLEEGPATKLAKRASTWAVDASNLNRHIRPLLGRKLANQVTEKDANRAIKDIIDGKTAKTARSDKNRGRVIVRGGEGTARRTRITAAAMFAWGVKHGYVTTNPFAGIKMGAAPKRERFLSREEAHRVIDAIEKLEARGELSRTFADAIRLLLLTGARKTEVLGLRWSEVDFARRVLLLPPERTKAGGQTGERRIMLSPPALQLLERRLREAEHRVEEAKSRDADAEKSPFVFPAARGNRHRRGLAVAGAGHAIGLRRAFQKVMQAAGVSDVRVHDTRHTFASFLIADGASLFLVAKLLGHASAKTAERYAHLSADPLADAAAVVGARLMPGKAGENDGLAHEQEPRTAEVLQLRR